MKKTYSPFVSHGRSYFINEQVLNMEKQIIKLGYRVDSHIRSYIITGINTDNRISVTLIGGNRPPLDMAIDAITEIHCPHRGLIWSKEK